MPNSNLTQQQIDDLVSDIERHPWLVSFGSDELNPLSEKPSIEADVEKKDVTLYELEGRAAASYISKYDIKVTITTRNIAVAETLLSAFKIGDNVFASANKKALTLVPITSVATAKTITFANAYLQPGAPDEGSSDGEPNTAKLEFICKPDQTTGKPWTKSA